MTSRRMCSLRTSSSRVLPFVLVAMLATMTSSHSFAQDIGVGRSAFKLNCAACHGVAGKGDGPAAVFLKHPPGDLTRLARNNGGNFPSRSVSHTIDGRGGSRAHGTREMPVWGDRFWVQEGAGAYWDEAAVRRRIRSIVAYIESIQE